jgi:bacillithiol synthase
MNTVTQVMAPELNLHIRAIPAASPQLYADYFDASPKLAPFFAGFPWDADAARRCAQDLSARFPSSTRRAMAEAVKATTPAAQAKLERIAAGDGFFVCTGQQAGLFSGPLFTVYKTLTAIKLAEHLEEVLGVTVAPLFWVAADDHDFAEVNHAFVFGADSMLHRVEVDGDGNSAHSMDRQLLDNSVNVAIEQLTQLLPANELSQQTIQWIRGSYVPGVSMAAAFKALIESMFARYDLLTTSSAHQVVKSMATSVILRELDRSEQHEQTLRRQSDRLLAAGYHEQVSIRPGAANVLYEDEEGRDRLVRKNGGWHLSRTKKMISAAELNDLLTVHPERFSANVLLRPVVASAVFPTIAYVGGPAEVSYHAQIGCLFAEHDVPMPLVMPRASFEIIEQKVHKVLDKFGLEPSAFRQPFDQLASQVMRDDLPPGLTATVSQLRDSIAQAYAALVDASAAIDPTLRGPLENARNASHKALADVEKKIVSHLKKKNEIGIEQLRKASNNLYPQGEPQERVVSAISYLARYGSAFLDAIAAEISFANSADASAWRGVQC